MTAEQFQIFLEMMKTEYDAPRNRVAAALGCHRTTISSWEKNGCPVYIDLAISAMLAGLDPFEPIHPTAPAGSLPNLDQ
jgi:hypothetical protein